LFGTNANPNQLVAYSDADYVSCLDTHKSISKVVLMLNNGPIICLGLHGNKAL